ncbi:MAG: HAMP domain-containing histidine kinase [Leptolyngbyaceae cyanobacterium SL_1_1]|nr:HAMP domain-containing histidine kinase [Leptolyngbyaceae cyanobacterium SL_1_1]
MGIGISTLAGLGWLYAPRLFVVSLERIEGRGYRIQQMKTQLVKGFEFAWTRGMFWSIVMGGTTAVALSYWMSRRIVRPLLQLEAVTDKFAAGHFAERVPGSDIPELSRLAASFNRMATEIEGVEQRRRDLVSDLSHELRTPLTIVRGYLEGLADGTLEPSAEIYQRLTRETIRLQRLVNDLQELSKLEAGYLPIHLQQFRLVPLLQSLVQRFSDQISDQQPLRLELACAETLPLVRADPERVEQIMVNLLSNALRYTPEGSITVKGWAEGDRVWTAVLDTGEGIAADDLPHVFERFWRADRSRDRHSGGTGIGLAICKRLVELQGGQIFVDSQLGQGSTFRFWLPAAPKKI